MGGEAWQKPGGTDRSSGYSVQRETFTYSSKLAIFKRDERVSSKIYVKGVFVFPCNTWRARSFAMTLSSLLTHHAVIMQRLISSPLSSSPGLTGPSTGHSVPCRAQFANYWYSLCFIEWVMADLTREVSCHRFNLFFSWAREVAMFTTVQVKSSLRAPSLSKTLGGLRAMLIKSGIQGE